MHRRLAAVVAAVVVPAAAVSLQLPRQLRQIVIVQQTHHQQLRWLSVVQQLLHVHHLLHYHQTALLARHLWQEIIRCH